MKKIVTIQTEVELSEKHYGKFSNSQILQMYEESDLDFSSFIGRPIVFIGVNDAGESEVDNGNSAGETDGTTGLHEVPY